MKYEWYVIDRIPIYDFSGRGIGYTNAVGLLFGIVRAL